MNKIHLLDNNLINKIAAGEVIERPASVVKELVENSVDAGATMVTVTVKDGGISLISVSDNGRGIPADEVKTAFLRHATSKLTSFEDLEDIATLGFRGEALASIAAVSQLEMTTRTEDSDIGTRIRINGGKIEDINETGAPKGTVINVNNLFYNTPARKKFLKRSSTEGTYVAEVMNRMAMGHPEVAFKLIGNGNVIMQSNGNGDLKTAAYGILGRDSVRAFVPVDYKTDGWRVAGFAAKPEVNRGNRSHEYFYINGRFIKSEILTKGAEEGYRGYLMNGRFPVFVLNVIPAKGSVDVNVHPAKLEVRFDNDSFMFELVSAAVSKALKGEVLIPGGDDKKPSFSDVSGIKAVKGEEIAIDLDKILSEIEEREENEETERRQERNNDSQPVFRVSPKDAGLEEYDMTPLEPMKVSFREAVPETKPEKAEIKPEIRPLGDIIAEINKKDGNIPADSLKQEVPERSFPEKRAFFRNYKIIGQIFFTYWLVEQGNELYIIDQHAAHEKVLFERLSKALKEGKVSSQMLLEPVTVTVTQREKKVIEDNAKLFEKMGFEIEAFGRNTYAIRAVPFIFDGTANPVFFMDIVDGLMDRSIRDGFELKEDRIATMSCKAAVKGNNVLTVQEARALIDDLLKLENPFNCPHGRPTIIKMSKYEIEKKFKRVL